MTRSDGDNPDISVVVATYNRADSLGKSLRALCEQEMDSLSWQLIVADNNSSDDTRSVCESFEDRLPIHYVFEPQQGKNHAVNAALAVACGELIVMTDDDVTPCPTWLRELWRASRDWPDHDVFCGPVTTHVPPAFAGTLEGAVPTCNFQYAGGAQVLPADLMPIGANFAYRRRIQARFDRSLFDPRIGPSGTSRISGSESVALRAFLDAGYGIVYVPTATMLHETPRGFRSIGGLCRRAFAQGRGDVCVLDFGQGCRRLFGVPRFLWRTFFDDVAAMLIETAGGRRKKALHRLFHATRVVASILEWRRRCGENGSGVPT